MAHGDAVGVNEGNRILSHGAPLPRMMPNGCLGSPVIVLLLVLTEASSWMSDRSATSIVLSAVVDVSSADWRDCAARGGVRLCPCLTKAS